MKISDIKIYTLDAFRTNWAFIKVETDEGLYGWGEATLGTQEMSLEGCISDYKRLIVGRDPLEVERMLFEVYRDSYWKGGPVMMSALAGIEIACWDIAGKFRGVPVHALLGGKMRDRVKMYANAWFVGAREPEEFAAAAKKVKALGIQALKWDPFGKAHMTLSRAEMDHAVAVVGAVREAVGPEMEILIECHGRFNHYTAVAASKELAPFKPMLMEEPVVPDNNDSLAWVRDHSAVPVAAGERFYGMYAWNDVLRKIQEGRGDVRGEPRAGELPQPVGTDLERGHPPARGDHAELPHPRDDAHGRLVPPPRHERECEVRGRLPPDRRQARARHRRERQGGREAPLQAAQPPPLHGHAHGYPPERRHILLLRRPRPRPPRLLTIFNSDE